MIETRRRALSLHFLIMHEETAGVFRQLWSGMGTIGRVLELYLHCGPDSGLDWTVKIPRVAPMFVVDV